MRSPILLQLKVNEFRRGENSEGGRIGYYRNPNYRLFKQQLNPLASGTVDLFLTGSFTRQLFIEERGKGLFQFDSYDDKAPELFEKYDNIRGLREDTFIEWQNDYLVPELGKYVIQRIR